MIFEDYQDLGNVDRPHRIGVVLAGCGGTGGQVLHCLARMHVALVQLGHPGLFVVAVDPDVVERPNIGRQQFAPQDLELPKASVLVTRVNRYYGLDWRADVARLAPFDQRAKHALKSNYMDVLVSCVDSGPARAGILDVMQDNLRIPYWMDFGNSRRSGQMVFGTVRKPLHGESMDLPHVLDLFPGIAKDVDDDEPSCSMEAALDKQDLYVNATLANLGMNVLWRLIREGRIESHGLFLNLEGPQVQPLPVSPETWRRMGMSEERVSRFVN